MESEQARYPALTRWMLRQWWVWFFASVMFAATAFQDVAGPTSENHEDAAIGLALAGLLLLASAVAFRRRKRLPVEPPDLPRG